MNHPATRWSLILASGETDIARTAWEELAANYRSAIHAYFRCRFGVDPAEDLTQAFLAESAAGSWWSRADLDRGTFRTYLRMLLQRFGAHHAEDSTHARTYGDDVERLVEPGADPEVAFEREFARTLVAHALARLRAEQTNPYEYETLLPSLLHRGDHGDLKRLAHELGLMHNTLLHRLRRMRMRLRELLRDEFAQLVAEPALINVELLRIQRNLKHRKL